MTNVILLEILINYNIKLALNFHEINCKKLFINLLLFYLFMNLKGSMTLIYYEHTYLTNLIDNKWQYIPKTLLFEKANENIT